MNGLFHFLICALIVLAVLLSSMTLSVSRDDAMSPFSNKGNIVLTTRIPALLSTLERGDVITFRLREEGGNIHILQRRIIGFPGESIEIMDGMISVDGQVLDEPYASGETKSSETSFIVPLDTYFVLCDERDDGPDSRTGFYVVKNSVIGKAVKNFNTSSDTSANPVLKMFDSVNKLVWEFK